jgi:tetratricopeptide (TPR) repeat protein
MKRALTILLVLGVWVVAGVFTYRAWERVQRQGLAGSICDAVAAEDFQEAVRRSEGVDLPGPEGRRVTECRAFALFGLGDRNAGISVLEARLAEEPEWIPSPLLAAAVVEGRRSLGRLQEAWEVLDPAVRAYPDEPLLVSLELAVRAALEDEQAVMEEFRRRLPRLERSAAGLSMQLAQRYLDNRETQRALELLGDTPPPLESREAARWYALRAEVAAAVGDMEDLAVWIEAWRTAGASAEESQAAHALLLSVYGLNDPERPTLEMLRQAAANAEALSSAGLRRGIFVRLIATLTYLDQMEEALEVYAAQREALDLDLFFEVEELERLREQGEQGEQRLLASVGTVRVVVPALPGGATVWLSPDLTAPVDTPYEAHAIAPAGGVVEVRRHLGKSPQRWVLWDGEGALRGSGTIWPADGGTVEVRAEPRTPQVPRPFSPQRTTADGRRRVFAVVLDCADWRLVRYLQARGDLPVLEALLERGRRGVLYSDPPNTAAAMEALVYPNRRRSPSFVGLVYQMGDEIAGLNFVGENPFAPLHWLVPATDSLFDALGAGERVTVNLLFSRGTVDAGRHGDLVGPRSQRRRFTDWRARRPLTAEEAAHFPRLVESDTLGPNGPGVEEAAADLDATLTAIERGDIDLLVQRVASLDIFTHSSFGAVTRAGQEDGQHAFFDFYRYLDRRLGEVHNALDGDDLLVIFSDHGIKTSLQHREEAFFLVVGGAVVPGRVPETPNYRGVSRFLADLFGVETDWPDSGLTEAVFSP